jgi:hypothetical protein
VRATSAAADAPRDFHDPDKSTGHFAPTLHEVSSERPVSAPLKYVPVISGL